MTGGLWHCRKEGKGHASSGQGSVKVQMPLQLPNQRATHKSPSKRRHDRMRSISRDEAFQDINTWAQPESFRDMIDSLGVDALAHYLACLVV